MPLGKSEDLTKNDYDGFTVIKRVYPITKARAAHWLCKCSCGNYFVTLSTRIKNGSCKSCGHIQKEIARKSLSNYKKTQKGKPQKDYVGYVSGKLTVISFSHIDKNHHSVWNCKCECGNNAQITSSELSKKEVKSCGCLRQSYGSYLIEKILKENNIKFEREKTFNNCRFPDTNALARFDFYVNGQLIEFDGKQHYEFVGGYFTEDSFKKLQERDRFKDNWCKKNNIPLIRISYKDENKINLEYLKRRINLWEKQEK